MLEAWEDYWLYIKELCGIRGRHRKHKLVVLHLGDIIDGVHHGSTQTLPNLFDQQNEAERLLLPVATMADGGLYITKGTEAHAGDGHGSEAGVAEHLGARAYAQHLKIDIDGALIDACHHTRGAKQTLAQVIEQYALNGEALPRFVLRGHKHVIEDTGETASGVRAVVCPAWQLRTAYGWKVAPNRRSDIGGMIIINGELSFIKARYRAVAEGIYHV